MFKNFQDTSRSQLFKGFPNLNFQMNNEAYGFSGCTFWLDAAYGLNTQTNLAAVSKWIERIKGLSYEQLTGANQPRLLVADPNFNNLPTVDFSADAARKMETQFGDATGLDVPTNFTIAVIAKYGTLNGRNCVIGNRLSTAGTNTAISFGGTQSGINGVTVETDTATIRMTGTTESTTPKIAIITNTELVVNGVQEASTTAFNFDRILNQLGSSRDSVTSFTLRGQIAEIVVFASRFSSANCIELSTRINSKYAIY
jgi:hypothetical protein